MGALQGTLREREFLAVLTQVNASVKRYVQSLDPQVNEITSKQEDVSEIVRLPFWIFKDSIVFAKADPSRDFLLPFIQDKLGIQVKIPKYNVQRLFEDKKDYGAIWGFGFNDRPGAISAGALYGEMDQADAMIQEVDGVDKNFVSMTFDVGGEHVKASIYKVGSIVIYKGWNKMAATHQKLKVIKTQLADYEEV